MKPHPLKVERELRGWSQARVAEAVGTNVRTVIRWEQGQSVPYPYHRELLCELFHKNARDLGLLEEVDKETPQELPSASRALELPLFDPCIPITVGSFGGLVGRDHLLSQLRQRLWEGGNFALTALQGLPGMGKTSLAMALASDETVRSRFRDGILWAGLGQEPDVLSHLARWGKLLGIAPAEVENVDSREAWERALRAAIGQRRLLLVIDDAWSIEDALAFQVGGPQCAHLLTTRLPHVAFAFAREGTLTIAELKSTDGLELLARYVPQLVEQEPERSRTLVQAVGGLPLALTLMGNYLAAQAFTGQRRRLQAALTRLHDTEQRLRLSVPQATGERSPSLPATMPLSLHAVIAVSAQRLSSLAHTALCDLALFPPKPNSFSEEAALAVSAASVEALDELWDAGLLESGGTERYTLHQTIADYARAHSQQTEARLRLIKYIGWYAQTYWQDYDALEQELSNIQAALDEAVALDLTQELMQDVVALMPFMRVRGHYAQADRLLQQALQMVARPEDTGQRAMILRHLAEFAQLRSDYALAESYAQQGLLLAEAAGGPLKAESALLTTLGLVALERGDYTQSRALCEKGLRLAREIGDREHICTLLLYLGRVLHYQGEYAQSQALYEEGLALARQLERQELIGSALTNLGSVMLEQGNYTLAEHYYQEGMSLLRSLGYRKQLSVLLNDMGVLASRRGNLAEALTYYQEGLELARGVGLRADICLFLSNLGSIAAEQEDYATAEHYLREGVELARQINNRNHLCLLLSNLGSVLGSKEPGAYEEANACFRESLELAHSIGSSWYLSNVLTEWGNIHLKFEQVDAAFEVFHEVLTSENLAETEPVMIGLVNYGLARVAAYRGDAAEAAQLGQQALKQFEALGHYKAREVAAWLQTQTE